jgi:CCR4-NOT transcription complex subunit 7/8
MGRVSSDMYANDSIELLQKSGIDFRRHEENGIDIATFGEVLITSGFVLFDEVHWISFHRCGHSLLYHAQARCCVPGGSSTVIIVCTILGTC